MKKIKIKLLSFIARQIFQLLFYLNKIDIRGEKYLTDLIDSQNPFMVCVWHGRLIFPSWYLRLKTTKVNAIASRNTDGEMMAQVLRGWGYGLIRGSTKKGGKEVVQKMGKIFKNSGIIAITNDGPKGPERIAKAGSIATAIKYNAQVITITGSATKYWQMKSWDKSILPKPFGKIFIQISPPLNLANKPKTVDSEVKYLSEFMNLYQDSVDELSCKEI